MSGSPGPDPPPQFVPGFSNVDMYTGATLRQILLATKYSNSIPGERRADWDYYDTFSGFRNVMNSQNAMLRDMIRNTFEFNGINKSRLGATEVADLMDTLSDANDAILERINMNLDEAAGIKKDADPLLLEVSQKFVAGGGSWNNFDRKKDANQSNSPTPVKLLAAKNVLRPQMKFSKFIDNSDHPFQPRLEEKPHAMKPLSMLVEYDGEGKEVFSHPYIYEMERDQPLNTQLSITVPVKPGGIEQTELMFVDNVDLLKSMISELSLETVIGIDVEHHNYRTYLGITCLIQISSANKDYLVDPFPIWSELPLLNEITANPKIVKVLHGCDSDVDWLQRDFSLYLRNIFDTHQAGKLLGLPRNSLAYLLSTYCGLNVDKQYQLADWRIRPLPSEMVYYARQDTRYLIYLYTRLKNELISRGNAESNLLHAALHQSNDICKKRYYKPCLHPDSHLDMVRKARATLNNKQLFCLKEMFCWRDKLGRTEDESVMYVLPNHMMMKIATELPREMQGILACCNPVPPLVRQHLVTLHNIVLSAREKQLLTVDPSLVINTTNTEHHVTNFSTINNLDLNHLEDAGELDTVINKKVSIGNNNLSKSKPDLPVFAKQRGSKQKPNVVEFMSPYQRFVMMKPYLDGLEEAKNVDQRDNNKSSSNDIRIDSIRQHFEKLTEMTPKAAEKKNEDAKEESEESGEVSSEEEVEPKVKKAYFEATDRVKNLRLGAQVKEKPNKGAKNKNAHFEKGGKRAFEGSTSNESGQFGNRKNRKKPRRKSESDPGQNKKEVLKRKGVEESSSNAEKSLKTEPKEFDYNNVNFKNFGSKKNENKDFNPNKSEKENDKKGGKKKNQFHKRGNRSGTFKKS